MTTSGKAKCFRKAALNVGLKLIKIKQLHAFFCIDKWVQDNVPISTNVDNSLEWIAKF